MWVYNCLRARTRVPLKFSQISTWKCFAWLHLRFHRNGCYKYKDSSHDLWTGFLRINRVIINMHICLRICLVNIRICFSNVYCTNVHFSSAALKIYVLKSFDVIAYWTFAHCCCHIPRRRHNFCSLTEYLLYFAVTITFTFGQSDLKHIHLFPIYNLILTITKFRFRLACPLNHIHFSFHSVIVR